MATKKAAKKAPAKKAPAKKTTTQKVPAKKPIAKKVPVKKVPMKTPVPKSGTGGAFQSMDKPAPQPTPDMTNNLATTAKKAADKMDQYIRS